MMEWCSAVSNFQQLEAVIRARIPSITSLINKSIDELESEMDHLGRPIASDAGVILLNVWADCIKIDWEKWTPCLCFCRLNCTSSWSFAVHLTKYLRNILTEGNCACHFYTILCDCLEIWDVNVKIADDLVVIEFMGFLIINSLLLCGSFHLTVTSLYKMLSGLYHKQTVISLI